MEAFKPGLHLIAKLTNCNKKRITYFESVQFVINEFIAHNKLNKLGEVYHKFENGGYTAVVCLSESHLSIHTWPEYDLVNMDIYLSNHLRQNDNLVRLFFNEIVNCFEATIIEQQDIKR